MDPTKLNLKEIMKIIDNYHGGEGLQVIENLLGTGININGKYNDYEIRLSINKPQEQKQEQDKKYKIEI